jgi:NAD+ kinase
MKIGIYGRTSLLHHFDYVHQVISLIKEKEGQISIYSDIINVFPQLKENNDSFHDHHSLLQQKIEVLLCLGGDGSMLDTVTLVKDSDIPVLGINLGRLGFLSSITKEDIEKSIHSLFKGSYQIDKRMLLELNSNFPLFEKANYALNEMTVQRSNSSSMIVVSAFMNGELLNNYFTDGLIISTPTGSTGYNLSCGGPILHPSAKNFIITPISPHNLNVRPIVLPEDVTLTFEVKGRTPNFLCTLDSRAASITEKYELAVKKASFTMNLIRLHDNSFLDALKDKLMWGLDQRK